MQTQNFLCSHQKNKALLLAELYVGYKLIFEEVLRKYTQF